MTSTHGNKTVTATVGVCLSTAALLLGGMASEKRAKIRMYEKKYDRAVESIQSENMKNLKNMNQNIDDGNAIADTRSNTEANGGADF